jgi:hypothetical protein
VNFEKEALKQEQRVPPYGLKAHHQLPFGTTFYSDMVKIGILFPMLMNFID